MSTRKPLNIGIVGYGFMGRTHAHAYHNAANFFEVPLQPVLKAACGRDEAKLQSYASNWGFESTETDWRSSSSEGHRRDRYLHAE
jgi:predicted dehydrogenase